MNVRAERQNAISYQFINLYSRQAFRTVESSLEYQLDVVGRRALRSTKRASGLSQNIWASILQASVKKQTPISSRDGLGTPEERASNGGRLLGQQPVKQLIALKG